MWIDLFAVLLVCFAFYCAGKALSNPPSKEIAQLRGEEILPDVMRVYFGILSALLFAFVFWIYG